MVNLKNTTMNTYIYEHDFHNGVKEFSLQIPLYWERIYKGKPREKLYHNYKLILEHLRKTVRKNRVVLDVGQNHGILSVPISIMGFPLLGFEPVLANYQSTVNNLELNQCVGYHCVQKALGNVNAEVEMFIPECPDNSSFSKEAAISNMKGKEWVSEIVQCVRFDDWIQQHPEYQNIGFIKLDTQGSEFDIISGMSDFLKKSMDVWMLVEFEHHLNSMGHTFEELHNLILSLGFTQKGTIGGDRLYYKP